MTGAQPSPTARHNFTQLRSSALYRATVRGAEVIRPYFVMLRFTAHFICISCRGFESNRRVKMHIQPLIHAGLVRRLLLRLLSHKAYPTTSLRGSSPTF